MVVVVEGGNVLRHAKGEETVQGDLSGGNMCSGEYVQVENVRIPWQNTTVTHFPV